MSRQILNISMYWRWEDDKHITQAGTEVMPQCGLSDSQVGTSSQDSLSPAIAMEFSC